MKVRKAVIPAAGLGTRVLPASKVIPKEMLPLADKPTIQYIVEEAVASGISDITLITSRTKRALEDYFDKQPELNQVLASKGKTKQLEELQKIESLATMVFVRQQEPKGLGHAVLMAQSTIGDEPFGVMLGDDVFVNPADPVLGQLIRVQEQHGGSVIAVMRVPRERIPSYGVIAHDPAEDVAPGIHHVRHMVEKPPIDEAPSDLAVMGRYVLSPSIFEVLEQTPPGANNEIQLTDAIRILGEREPIYAYEFTGTRYDTGDPIGLLTTSLVMALADERYAPKVKAFLRTLDLS